MSDNYPEAVQVVAKALDYPAILTKNLPEVRKVLTALNDAGMLAKPGELAALRKASLAVVNDAEDMPDGLYLVSAEYVDELRAALVENQSRMPG